MKKPIILGIFAVSLIVAIILGWRGFFERDPNTIPANADRIQCNYEAIKAIVTCTKDCLETYGSQVYPLQQVIDMQFVSGTKETCKYTGQVYFNTRKDCSIDAWRESSINVEFLRVADADIIDLSLSGNESYLGLDSTPVGCTLTINLTLKSK